MANCSENEDEAFGDSVAILSDNVQRQIATTLVPNLPESLKHALSSLSSIGEVHTGGSCELPLPGLRIEGLPETLAFPLATSQTQQLLNCCLRFANEKPADQLYRNCLVIDSSYVCMENSQWAPAVRKLVQKASEELGVPSSSVREEMDSLLIYKEGGHQRPQQKLKLGDRKFATLIICLPSAYKGGKFVVRHEGEEHIYTNGADDGSCEYSNFYTAFFADVEHEVPVVMSGCLLALKYNLTWTGRGRPPSAGKCVLEKQNVGKELKALADRNSNGAWAISVDLENSYTCSSLGKLGVSALTGSDKAKIHKILEASEFMGMGDLEVLLCRLSRQEQESNCLICGYCTCNSCTECFHVTDVKEGTTELKEVYSNDGSSPEVDLSFVKWDRDLNFTYFETGHSQDGLLGEKDSEVSSTCSHYKTCESFSALIWPKTGMTSIVPAENLVNVKYLLNRTFGEEKENLLAQITSNISELDWKDEARSGFLNLILEKCMEPDLYPYVLKIFQEGGSLGWSLHEKIVKIVSEKGWERASEIVTEFLCPKYMKMKNVRDRLSALLSLEGLIPRDIQLQAILMIIAHIRWNNGILPKEYRKGSSRSRLKVRFACWAGLFHVVKNLYCSANPENPGDERKVGTALVDVVASLKPEEIREMKQALSGFRNLQISDPFYILQKSVARQVLKLWAGRFIKSVEYILQNKSSPPEHLTLKQDRSRISSIRNNWHSFVSLAADVMSSKAIPKRCLQRFEDFLSAIHELQSEDRMSIALAVSEIVVTNSNSKKVFKFKLTKALEHADDLITERLLSARIRLLEQKTAEAPTNVQVQYDAQPFADMPDVQCFLAGTRIETNVTGFRNLFMAKRASRKIRRRLPPGFKVDAGGEGQRSYVWLRKPNGPEKLRWVRYSADKDSLKKALVELEEVQARIKQDRSENRN